MVLVIGGAYQGKLEYVLERYPGKSVFHCGADNAEIDFSADIINSLHLMALCHVRVGLDTASYLRGAMPRLKDKIVICDDIFCGVVPIDRETRLWREAMGRGLTMLSKNADEVIRVFCGIGSQIK